jgi:hypothetical protein
VETRDVLREAKRVLLTQGWRNDGSYGSDDGKGPVCILGACSTAIYGDAYTLADGNFHPVVKLLYERLPYHLVLDQYEAALFTWNDDFASFEEVIDLIDRALESLPVEAEAVTA